MSASKSLQQSVTREDAICWQVIVVVGLVLAVTFALNSPDIEGENVGNWFHAKLFLSNGGFINLPKSPLFQLYLTPFSLLPYPASIALERGCTVFLCFLPIAGLMVRVFGRFIGLGAIIFTAPDVLLTTPSGQVFAIALAFLAFLIRISAKPEVRFQAIMKAYALLLLAWGFRSNIVLILVIVVMWDLWQLKFGQRETFTKPRLRDAWSVAIVTGLLLITAIQQSPHRWNNYQLMDETWVGSRGQLASVISQMVGNHFYTRDPDTGGEPFDSYFTHKRFFGDAQTLPQMILANPQEIARLMIKNIGPLMITMTGMTALGEGGLALTPLRGGSILDHRVVGVVGFISLAALIVWMLYHQFRSEARRETGILSLGLIAVIAVSGLLTNASSPRILYPFYPLFMILAACCAQYLIAALPEKTSKPVAVCTGILMFLLISQGGWARADTRTGWWGAVEAAASANENGHLFYGGDKAALYQTVDQIWPSCKGLMPAEMPQFIGAFSTIDPSILYSPFEIPPFGHLGESPYDGLNPVRINCIYLPYGIIGEGPGSVTNIKIRARDYMAPYAETLLTNGYRRIDLPTGILVLPPT